MIYQNNLLTKDHFLTDGGLETTLIFHHGIDLPYFASFVLLNHPEHRKTLAHYYRQYLELAAAYNTGFVLESATWRANPDWAFQMGYAKEDLEQINRFAIKQLKMLKQEYASTVNPILISGCIGPRRDGYKTGEKMTVEEAKEYHLFQAGIFKFAGVDMVSGITINYLEEALGIVEAAKELKVPVVISLTVETDGNLPDTRTLKEVIQRIDQETNNYPSYYMINCAHPQHFADKLTEGEPWISRIEGIRANASCKSHAELDEATELDPGDKDELASWYQKLNQYLPNLKVYGGCCGTDISHIKIICEKMDNVFKPKSV